MPKADRLIELFHEAKAWPAGAERERFLAEACAGEPELKEQVISLLHAHEGAGDFLKNTLVLSPAALVTEKPGDTIGRYKLLQQLGEGGCGVVYMAEQTEPVRRKVALKVIKLGMDTKQVVARFEAERQALALMDHPNIAKVFDAGATDAGRPYFVMELVRGIRITDYCDENHLSTAERLDLFIQVCQAIQHAHQKGIIHRDIKPSNILVARHDTVAVPKVIDFGIAKATSDQPLTDKTVFTAFAQFMGTPAYMSPEQAQLSGLDIDTRTDIYSLGVLLYELLTGETPFDPEELVKSGLEAMRKTIREKEPVRPSKVVESRLELRAERVTGPTLNSQLNPLSTDLDWIVMKCLEKERTRRYETANSLAADLQRHLSNEPVIARPATAAYRFRKLVRRNKLAFTVASAAAGVLVLGAAVSTWQAVRATKAERQQTSLREAAQTERDHARAAQRLADLERERANQQRTNAERHLYVVNMNLAQAAWEQNNFSRTRQLLEETTAYPQRGFEWYYWQRQTHLELAALRGHRGGILAVAFSPDGQRIVTGSYDQTAKVWEAVSGKELLTLKGHSEGILSVAFSPDGQWLVTGGGDRTAKVWEAANGKEVVILRGHTHVIPSVAFSPDSQRIVTGSYDQTAKVWEAASGKELLTLKGHSEINSVGFSLDGQRIVTGSYFLGTQVVWDSASGKQQLTLKWHHAAISSLAFSPDGQRIVTGSHDRTAKVWEVASGKELRTLKGHSGRISSAAFSPNAQQIVTGSDDQTARIWDASSGRELLTLKGHSKLVRSVVFSPNGQRIVTGSEDQTAKVWDAASGQELITLKRHSSGITAITVAAFSPDGQRIVTGGNDQTAKVWELASGKELLAFKGHNTPIDSVAFSPDGHRIATGGGDMVKVWEAASGKELLTLNEHNTSIHSVAFSPDGQRIVTGSDDQTAKTWDTSSGKQLLTLEGHNTPIFSVAFSSDGQRIVTGSRGMVKVWEAANGKELLTLNGHSDAILAVAFSPDGQRVVTGSNDQTTRVWEMASGKELLTLQGHSGVIHSVAFSPDGQRIVTGSQDQTTKVWETTSGRELLTLKSHSGGIYQVFYPVAFSPDGLRIVTGRDETVEVWQAATREQVARWQSAEQAAPQSIR